MLWLLEIGNGSDKGGCFAQIIRAPSESLAREWAARAAEDESWQQPRTRAYRLDTHEREGIIQCFRR